MTKDEALKLALEWAESHGEIVFAGGGMGAVTGMNAWAAAVKEALAQPEQEPSVTKTGCGILTLHSGFDDLPDGTKFYTTPPKRPWVGLTDEEIIAADMHTLRVRGDGYTYARAVEAKLKEKNT